MQKFCVAIPFCFLNIKDAILNLRVMTFESWWNCCFWLKKYEIKFFLQNMPKTTYSWSKLFSACRICIGTTKKHLIWQILYFLHLKCLQKMGPLHVLFSDCILSLWSNQSNVFLPSNEVFSLLQLQFLDKWWVENF